MTGYVGEIRMFAGNFAPAGWMFCNGAVLPISEYDTLFQLIGTTYGGDGMSTFQLPDLQGRVPLHQGQGSGLTNRVIGETGGVENVTLTTQQIPVHTHAPLANSAAGTTANPTNAIFGAGSATQVFDYVTPFNAASAQVALNAATIALDGGSQPHDNIQPTLAYSYIISLYGYFPSPT